MKRFAKALYLFSSSPPNQMCTKCITWPKKYGKGRQEWYQTCLNLSIHLRKLNTLMKTK
jgi:hypothetical protein